MTSGAGEAVAVGVAGVSGDGITGTGASTDGSGDVVTATGDSPTGREGATNKKRKMRASARANSPKMTT